MDFKGWLKMCASLPYIFNIYQLFRSCKCSLQGQPSSKTGTDQDHHQDKSVLMAHYGWVQDTYH